MPPRTTPHAILVYNYQTLSSQLKKQLDCFFSTPLLLINRTQFSKSLVRMVKVRKLVYQICFIQCTELSFAHGGRGRSLLLNFPFLTYSIPSDRFDSAVEQQLHLRKIGACCPESTRNVKLLELQGIDTFQVTQSLFLELTTQWIRVVKRHNVYLFILFVIKV